MTHLAGMHAEELKILGRRKGGVVAGSRRKSYADRAFDGQHLDA
jgi:hypothetical protein